MSRSARAGALMVLAMAFMQPARAADSGANQPLLDVVQGFYTWVLGHGKAVRRLEPKIREDRRTHRLSLDVSTLPAFSDAFLRSGYFATSFGEAISRYYVTEQHKLGALSQQEFDQLARDGRGPMMDTEDMDIFFCAQEYEYKSSFVRQLRIKSADVEANEATAVVVSPLGWETTFRFTKAAGRWRIAAYCVYQ